MTAAAVGIMMVAGICAGQSYWKRTYGGTDDNCANAITPTPDGNFIIAGYTTSFGAGNKDVYLLKIKPNGDTIWTKTYGGTLDGGANAIIQTKDGNFIVAGYTSSFGMGGEDVYLLKINSDGDTIWTKTYGGPVDDTAHTIAPTLDGNFIVAGSYGGIVRSVYLLKIKPNGDTIWTKSYNIGICDAGFAITPTTDGGFIIVGTSEIPSDYQ